MDPRMLNVPESSLRVFQRFLCDAFRSELQQSHCWAEVLEVVTPKPVDDTRLPLWRFGVPTVIMWFSKGPRIAWRKGVYIIRYVCIYIHIHITYIYTDTKNGRYGRRPSIPRRYDFVFCANIVGLGCWAVQGTMVFWGTPMVFWWLKPVETTTALAKQPCCLQHGTCLPVFFCGENCGKTTFLQTFWRDVYCVWLQMAQHNPMH